jgi:methylthioribose-1-phosphate isomerase
MRTVDWDPQGYVTLIDQRALPAEVHILRLRTAGEVADAIRTMAVRGAPALGIAAALGLGLSACDSTGATAEAVLADLESAAAELRAARPTAVNIAWAVDRVLRAAGEAAAGGIDRVRQAVLEESRRLADEDVEVNRRLSAHGAALLQDGDTVIHHCNTGALAAVDYGTALGVIRTAHEQGKRIHVLVDETRPRLQGSRLTAWELQRLHIPFEIIPDSAAGSFLRAGEVAAVLVGADRVAANGDVGNKIGTYMLALAAKDNAVPFYCALPTSTIDLSLPTGEGIPIEWRDPGEVLDLMSAGQPVAPAGARARNPAFDITPARLVTAFVTEVGVLRAPFPSALASAVKEASRP